MAETKTLESGTTVTVKDMSIDDMDTCKDAIQVTFDNGVATSVSNVNKGRTMWLRKGLSQIGDWKAKNGEMPPDSAIKSLSDKEQQEVSEFIQKCQVTTKKKPLNSNSMS